MMLCWPLQPLQSGAATIIAESLVAGNAEETK
jgi:hypothetical protein